MPLADVMAQDINDVFFEDFGTDAIYSVTGVTVKVIKTDYVDMSSGYNYKSIMVKVSDIPTLDYAATFTIDGLKYGFINDSDSTDYTDIHKLRLNKKGT